MNLLLRLAVLLHDIEDAKYKSDENPTVREILEMQSVQMKN